MNENEPDLNGGFDRLGALIVILAILCFTAYHVLALLLEHKAL